MNLCFLIPTLLAVAASIRPETFACVALSEAAADDDEIGDEEYYDLDADQEGGIVDDDDDDDDYYDLENMTDEELEEICTSRGFQLGREPVDADTGEPTVYTHEDYVNAASECLQIEADLEEILETHPEILDDVRRESERMMEERERLMVELNQHQQAADGPTERPVDDVEASEDNGETVLSDAMNATSVDAGGDAEDRSENTLDYDVKEITLEVLRQMKSDFAKVANFVVPEKLREKIRLQVKQQIWPAIKPFVSVAKGMTTTTYGMARRYFAALVSGRAGGDEDAPIRDAKSDEEDTAALVEERTTAA